MERNRSAYIDWEYSGAPNPMVGTGATWIEQALVWVTGLSAFALFVYLGKDGWFSWSWFQIVIASLIAFDLIGGAVANQLNSAKRFFHAPLKTNERGLIGLMKQTWYFSAIHIHPIVVYTIWKPQEFLTGVGIYGAAMASAGIVRMLPFYLARPVATLLLLAALLANTYLIRPVPGFEWLLPVLFLKLVLGHAVREEPYRP